MTLTWRVLALVAAVPLAAGFSLMIATGTASAAPGNGNGATVTAPPAPLPNGCAVPIAPGTLSYVDCSIQMVETPSGVVRYTATGTVITELSPPLPSTAFLFANQMCGLAGAPNAVGVITPSGHVYATCTN